MAADNKNLNSTAQVGDGGNQSKLLGVSKLGPRTQKRAVAMSIAILVLLSGWWLYNNYSGGAVFIVNGKRYSHAEVKELAAYQTDKQHIPYKTAAKKVYDALRYQAAAQSLHITVTPDELKSSVNVDKATYKKYKTWIDIVEYVNAVKANLSMSPATSDGAQGYAYIFWFGDAVQPSYNTPAPKYGNQQAYKDDQQYALERANYYHDQLKNKKMTPDQVLTAVKRDPKLAPRGQTAANSSTRFGTKTYQPWQDELNNNAIASYVKSASDNSLSSVRTDTTATRLGLNSGQYVAAYYYVVLVQKAHIPNITQQLNNKLSSLNARYYGV